MKLKELIEKSELSYATIRKYVDYGLIDRPQVEYRGPGESISHYPDDSLKRIELIKAFKKRRKTLLEIKEVLPKALAAFLTREELEKQHGRAERNLEPSPERWLQLSVELMLKEAGVSADEISDKALPVWLKDIKVERTENGEVEAIRIEKNLEAKSDLEAAVDQILQS